MRILNFGSLNLDYVYYVDHILNEGETISSSRMEMFCGGKGLNQSIALARAGVSIYHAGIIGDNGQILIDVCNTNKIDTTYIKQIAGESGHTIIQIDKNGQNGILLFGGSNIQQSKEYIDEVLSHFDKGDMILLQNEINLLDYIIDSAFEHGLQIAFNPSPFDDKIMLCDLSHISYLFLNEIEGEQITGTNIPDKIIQSLHKVFPKTKIILTLGKNGVIYCDENEIYKQGIFPLSVVDTTAAGDTFTGYFLSSIILQKEIEEALQIATMASAITVSRMGASASIPQMKEVINALEIALK